MGRYSRREYLALCGTLPVLGATDYPQGTQDVSRLFEAAAGCRVTQITDSAYGNQLSYYDIPCYAHAAGRLIYNTVLDAPKGKPGKQKVGGWGVVSSRADGTDTRLLVSRVPATTSTTRVDMSQDGKLVTYTRRNDDDASSWDLYGFRVGDGRAAAEFRITRLRTPVGQTNKVKTSPPSWDGVAGKYLCAFSIDERVYLVYDDGTGLAEAQLTDLIEFPDRRKEDTSYHRIRLNPVFPRLLYYRRNGVKDNWLIDLAQPQAKSRRISDYQASIHATWSADGRVLAGSMHGPWVEWTVADGRGRLLASFAQREIGPFGQNGKPGIFYGCYSGDGRTVAVATRYDHEPGGSLWLMNRESGKATYLCKARYFGPDTAGQPRMGFIDGGRALVFSSDNSVGLAASSPPQLYVVRPLPGV